MADKLKLGKHEKLLIDRLRQNKTQVERANELGVSRTWYGKIEVCPLGISDNIPIPEVSNLSQTECCIILRRRYNFSQDYLAKEIGVSRTWLGRMERGQENSEPLIKWFTDKGHILEIEIPNN